MIVNVMEMQSRRAQSAMEYLMTYGWAILIIAVVLVALFSLGVFKPSTASVCLGQTGFICQSAIYQANGNVIATIGQATGTSWATANVEFFAQGSSNLGSAGNPPTFTSGVYNALSSGISSGQTVAVTLPATGTVSPGATLSGTIWAQYTVSGSSSVYYVEMASVNLNAQ